METIKYPIRSAAKQSQKKITLTAIIFAAVGVTLYCIASGAELAAVASLVIAAACDYFARKN
jgi:hypothetical protein